jgi:hypothetical protein
MRKDRKMRSKLLKIYSMMIDLKKNKVAGKLDSFSPIIGRIFKRDKPTVIPGEVTIENPIPIVTEVKPNQGIQNSSVTLLIGGLNLRPGARVLLRKGQFRIGASKVTVISDTQVECELNLRGAEAGAYDLKIVNDDGQSGIFVHSFIVAGTKIN